ncbi:MAG: recombinase family protein [Archaeoglobaceae archaeon]
MKRAAAYARFSTDKQYDTSIEKQLEDIREYCKKKGYQIVKEYVDKAESAAKEDRPAFQQMLRDARQHLFDVVVVHKLNRLARDRYLSVVTAHELKKFNVEVESVLEPIGSDPVGQLLWGILDAVNEFERLNLIQEVKLKSRPLAAKGYWLGGRVPFGFKAVRVTDESGKQHTTLVVNEEEAPIVQKMFELFLQGLSFTKIAETLNEAGYTNRGKPWHFSAVSEIIKNPRYVGQHFWSKGTKTNHRIIREDAIFVNGPAIIDKETWQKAQERLQKYVRTKPAKYHYVLRGLVFCECGAPMYGNFSRFAYYRCKHYAENPSQHVSVSAPRLEKFVHTKIARMLSENIDFERLTQAINDIHAEMTYDIGDVNDLVKQQQEYMQMIENLTTALAKTPAVAQQIIIEKLNEYNAKLEEINKKINYAAKFKRSLTVDEVKELFEFLQRNLNENFELVVRKLIKSVTVFKSGFIEIEMSFIE